MNMKKATPKVMKLIDKYSGLMECRICGSLHIASIEAGTNGNFYRGSWQCVHGCKLDEKDK